MTRSPLLPIFLTMVGFFFLGEGVRSQDTFSVPTMGPLPATVKPAGTFPETDSSSIKHVAVVTPSLFVPSLQPWIAYRQSRGYRIHLVTPQPITMEQDGRQGLFITPETIRSQIRALATEVPLSAILIVGDGARLAGDSTYDYVIPTPRVETEVIDQFGPEDHIAADDWYADLDDDGIPDLAIGRFPVRTPQQLDLLIRKIIDYETTLPAGLWQRKISFIAGLAGFSPILDNVINNAVRQILASTIPNDFDFLLAMANWKSPYCPDPKLFRFTAIDQINQGPLFWVYMGHGLHQELDQLVTPEGNYRILELSDLRHIECRGGFPILIFCACYTGAFDSSEPTLAEESILLPRGPVATIASSRTSMPYGMAVFGVEMIEEAFFRNPRSNSPTLGALMLAAKRRMDGEEIRSASPKSGLTDNETKKTPEETPDETTEERTEKLGDGVPVGEGTDKKRMDGKTSVSDESDDGLPKIDDRRSKTRQTIDGLAKTFDPTAPRLDRQLADHRHLFNLFGDPLLQIRFPKEIPLTLSDPTNPSDRLTVSYQSTSKDSPSVIGWSPEESETTDGEGAEVLVELVTLPTRPRIKEANRKDFSLTDQDRITYQRTFEEVNDRVLSSARGEMTDEGFSVELPIPSGLSGTFIVRAVVISGHDLLSGGERVKIRNRGTGATSPENEGNDSEPEGEGTSEGRTREESEKGTGNLESSENGRKIEVGSPLG